MRPTLTAERNQRRSQPVIGVSVVALAVTLAIVVAAGAGACGGGSSPAPAATVTVTASASASPSASPSPSSTGTAATAQLVVAVAGGPKANGISVVNASGKVKQLVAPSGGPIRDISWAPGGTRSRSCGRSARRTPPAASSCTTSPGNCCTRSAPASRRPTSTATPGSARPSSSSRTFRSAPRPITPTAPSICATSPRARGRSSKDSAGHVVRGVAVSASAEATRIAFVTYGAKTTGQIAESLRLYDADDLGVSTVATGQAPTGADGDQFTWPSISPDGALVAALQTGSDIGFGCTVYGADGTKHLQSSGLIWPAPVSWTSQGPRLAFGGGRDTGSGELGGLLVWSAGASKATPVITGLKQPLTSLAWTPKASQIAYAVAQPSGLQSALWIVNADGSNRHLLLATGAGRPGRFAPVSFP